MRISELITEAEEKDTNFAKEVGSDLMDIPKGMWSSAKDIAKTATDPETYTKAGEKARDAVDRGIDFAKKDPEGAAKYALKHGFETWDDYMRAMANTLTFGYADKLAAKTDAMTKGTDYDTELKKQYAQSADASERSPIATTLGDIGGVVLSPAFGAGVKGAGMVAKAVAPKVVKALEPVAGQVAKNIAKGIARTPAELAAGISAEKGVAKGMKKLDPKNPHLYDVNEETLRLKELIKYRY